MSVRDHGVGVSLALCLISSQLGGCAISAVSGDDEDADLRLSGDPAAWEDAGQKMDADVPRPDGAVAEQDAGTPVPPVQRDAATVTNMQDAGSKQPDATVETLPLMVDGVVHDDEWSSATWTTQNTPSNWGTTKNVLLSLAVTIKDGALWLAVRGSIESTNALIVYFDSTPGIGLAPNEITDQTGALDDALSAPLTTPPGFKAELAWGTRSMNVSAASGFDATMGFRGLVDAKPGDLSWIDGSSAPSVCSIDACEARIPLTYLGAGSTVSLFARIATATGGTFSNQTLPADAAETPANVTQLLTLSR